MVKAESFLRGHNRINESKLFYAPISKCMVAMKIAGSETGNPLLVVGARRKNLQSQMVCLQPEDDVEDQKKSIQFFLHKWQLFSQFTDCISWVISPQNEPTI